MDGATETDYTADEVPTLNFEFLGLWFTDLVHALLVMQNEGALLVMQNEGQFSDSR